MQIYLARNNVQAGPYSLDQLNTMLASGEVVLDDLIWHEGMTQWQRLGNVTGNQYYYQPNLSSNHTNTPQNSAPQQAPQTNNSDSNNTNSHNTNNANNENNQRVSIDKLYGRTTQADNTNDTANKQNIGKQTTGSSVSLTKPSETTGKTLTNEQGHKVTLAPIMSRFLALAINGVLYLVSILPLLLALTSMDIDFEKFQSISDFDVAYQYSLTLVESIPKGTLMLSQAMMFGLFVIQLILITLRGQSLGKAITGIRVVDPTTHHLPSLGRLVGMRTLVLLVIYNILFSVANIVGFIAIAINYFMASKSPENIGWHDKLAKTIVVKAEKDQLNKNSAS